MSENNPTGISFRNSDVYPASLIQRQFWVLHSCDPYSPAYNMPSVSVIEGDLDVTALDTAINALLRHHRIFRATFDIDNSGMLVQRFVSWQRIPLPQVDLRPSQGSLVEETVAEQAVTEEIRRPFDLASGPPLRFRLFRTGERSYILVITAHHIVIDLATKDLFAEELAKEYRGALLDQTGDVFTEVADYAAFSAWQELWLRSDECKKMETAWRHYLDGAEPLLNLPANRPIAAGSRRPGTIVPIRLTHEMLEQLRTFCRKEEVAPFLVLLTAWALTLARWSRQTKLCVGVPLTNRRKDEFKKTMGCFVNILPLALDISDNPTMRETLRRVRMATLQMHRMQEMPYYHLVQLMRHVGTGGGNPLFQVGFTFEHPMRLQLEGVSVKPKYIHHGGAQLDMFATFWEEAGASIGVIEYDSGRFDSSTMKGISESLLVTINEICTGTQRKVDTITLGLAKDLDLNVNMRKSADVRADGLASVTYPLSYNQQFLWFLYHLAPQSSAYNVAFVARVVSPVDFSRMEAALQKLVDRHPMLRTTYELSGGFPSMRINSSLDPICEHIDATGWSEEALDREVRQRYCEPFDLAKGPILRVQLFTRAPEDHTFLLTVHHIACDGWSIGILLKEFRDLYSINPAINLPAGAAPYTDFTRYQSEMLKGPEGERLWSFWKQQLAGELPELNLPVDKQRPRTRVPRGGTYHFSITGDFYQSIVSFARSSGATLFTFFLASFQALLMRYSSQGDILIGTPMASRPRKEDELTVGCYINPIVLRGTISADCTFEELLRSTRKTFTDAFEHRHYPFPLLVEQLSPARDPSRSPIFQVMFNFLNRQTLGEAANPLYRDKSRALAGESVGFGDLKMRPFPLDQEEGQFDLALEMIDNNNSLTGLLKFSTDLFEEATVARMASHFEVLLQGIVSNPNQRLSELPLLTSDERHQLLVSWNDTKVDYPADACIHELFEVQAKRTPRAVAVEFEGRCLTYAELDARSSQFAEHLQALGIGPDVLVALYVERSPEMVIALLGILRAGGAYLPLDRIFPRERLAFMLEDAKPRVLVTLTKLLGEIPPHRATVVCVDGFSAATTAQTAVDRPISRNLAYVLYTSGSTGKPKGVEISHRAVVNFLTSMRKVPGMNEHDTLLSVTTISFDILGLEIWLPLTSGAKVVLAPQEEVMDGKRLARTMAEGNATVMQATPATWRLLLESEWEGNSRLKILCGGEAWSQELARPLLSKCASLWNMYGPTETTIWSAVCQVRDGESVSIGSPIANTQFYVVDSHLQLVPVGVPGELLIGGDGLARGYLNRPELTAEKFIPDPFSPNIGSRLYRTGDMVRYLPDGKIEFIARLDQQVKLRGFRIELGDIESVLCAKEGIKQAAVMLHEDEEEKRLVAYIVPLGESKQSPPELRDYLKQKLPDYMVPAAFVILPELPLTPNGKVNRKALPIPGKTRQTERVCVAPSGNVERSIVRIWQDLLRVETVGVHDNFFDLGGHSLLLVRMAARLQGAFQKDVFVVDLFQHPTVREQAEFLRGEESGDKLLLDAQTRARRQRSPFGQRAPSWDAAQGLMQPSAEALEGIAVIGMACRFPGATSVDRFWENLRQGVESIRHFTDEELIAMGVAPEICNAPNYVKAAPLIDHIDLFDASFFGYAPTEAAIMDPQHRLFLECASNALDHAGYDPGSYHGVIGVFGGAGPNYYNGGSPATSEDNDVMETYQRELGNEKDYLATRVAYKLNLKGPSLTIQTACSTSLVAAHVACQNLWTYQCDMALAGGVSINARMKGGYFYEEGLILSPDGHCRAFDSRAQGTVAGQGVGIVVLKRLSDALADGDTIHAVIRGSAINNDGASRVGFTAPGVNGQAEVILAAQSVAGVSPEDITYHEAHGTGTPLGDPIEIKALTQAFRLATDKRGFCAIGSVKTNIGHLDTAAGVAGLIKTVLMLEHREIPPSLHFENPNPNLDLDSSPFFVNTQLRDWQSGGAPRRASVSSFGLGGTNAHMVVEEAPLPESPGPSRAWHLVLFSAKSEGALDAATANMAAHLKRNPELNLGDVAFTLQVGRKAFERRRMVVCSDVNDAIAALGSPDPKRIVSAISETGHKDIVFMFSGQGSQYVNMGLDLYKNEPIFREQIDRCSEILQDEISVDLRKLLYPAQDRLDEADERLKQTSFTQPALFTLEFAIAKLWMAWGIRPQALVGHSIGEFTAACLADVFSIEDALKLVAARGRLMQEMPPGCMLAVSLSEREIQPFLGEGLSLSVINGPSLCVVSGEKEPVQDLEKELSSKNVYCRQLHTSHAFHSKMMEPVLGLFADRVKQVSLNPPQIPFVSNLTGTWITPDEATDPSYWAKHLRQTVRFSDCIQELLKEPNRIFLEVGPGQTLATLARYHLNGLKGRVVLSSVRQPKEEKSDSSFILNTLGQLWLAGVHVDWSGFHKGEFRHRVPLPTYPFERKRYWIGGAKQARGITSPTPDLFIESEETPLSGRVSAEKNLDSRSDGAPRNKTEQLLVDIWKELLGVTGITIRDNFFELGGSSLMAVRLFGEIQENLGKKLPVAVIFQAPTIEQLAAMLDVGSGKEVKSSLVKIQEGRTKLPLFCVPGNLGNVYTDLGILARHLGLDQTVYGLQDDMDHPSKIEALAAHYLREIRGVQPAGPYLLGGVCFGGAVAFEMAQQLLANGQSVGLLALIEPAPPLSSDFHSYMELAADVLGRLSRRSAMHSRNLSGMNSVERKFYLRLKWKVLTNTWAWKRYTPRSYPGRIQLFLTRESLKSSRHPRLGWRELALGGAEVHEIPGTHNTITGNNDTRIEEAHMEALAKKLRVCIDYVT